MLSRRSTASLARALDEFAHGEIPVLEHEFGLEGYGSDYGRLRGGLELVQAVTSRYDGAESRRILLDIAERLLRARTPWELEHSDVAALLLSALELDGLAFRDGRLAPTTPAPAILAPQLTALERQLEDRGLHVALTHFQQAADSFARGNHEACNGQVRPFIENLAIELCLQATHRRFDDAQAAFQHLQQSGVIEGSEWNICRGFWDDIQDNGPHHGLTTEQEALFRLHIATALARYLLWRIPANKGAA